MKEERYFYAPDASQAHELPADEASHAVRVLRLQEGDEIYLMDGVGTFHKAQLTVCTPKHCAYHIEESLPQKPGWRGHIHLAVAPTKNMDRMEWLAEKATEIGMDELSFLNCRFSERKVVKNERIEKILVSAMKQSHKAWKPQLNEMCTFKQFVKQCNSAERYICHCYNMEDVGGGSKPLLTDVMTPGSDAVVIIGPEGDFSVDEVKLAMECGFKCVSLGESRLRTETAALAAVHFMQWLNRNECQ